MVEIRKCDGGTPFGIDRYHKTVFTKFPCPTGYRELVFGENVDIIYDRITLCPKKISFWDEWGGQIYVATANGSHGEYYIWFIVKI